MSAERGLDLARAAFEAVSAKCVELSAALDRERGKVAMLREALYESVKLQSHQARLLNQYDGGERMEFANGEDWIKRLVAVGRLPAPAAAPESP